MFGFLRLSAVSHISDFSIQWFKRVMFDYQVNYYLLYVHVEGQQTVSVELKGQEVLIWVCLKSIWCEMKEETFKIEELYNHKHSSSEGSAFGFFEL